MSNIVVICPVCGPVIHSQFMDLSGNASVILQGENKASCPQCGTMATVPSGIYQAVGNTLRVLITSGRSLQELEALRHALQMAKRREASREEISETIKTHAPELKTIADTLPKTRMELYTLLAALIAAIALLKTCATAPEKTPKSEAEVQIAVEQSIEKAVAKNRAKKASQPVGGNRAQRRAGGRPLRPSRHK